MQCKLLQTILAMASLASLASALPTGTQIPLHDGTANTTSNIGPRSNPTAPQDRLIIDQMKTDGLPACYFECMVNNRDWLQADLYTDNLHAFCDFPGFWDTSNWIMYHVQFCIPNECGHDQEAADASTEWMKRTCDKIP